MAMRKERAMDHRGDLSRAERRLLLLPALASVVFGLGPILLPGPFWQFLLPGRIDLYIYELAGAAMFGYAVALFGALRQPRWVPVRLVVLAVLVFNLGSLLACGTALAGGAPSPSMSVIGAAALG